MYTVIEISEMLHVTVNTIYKAVYELQMEKDAVINKKNYYTALQVNTIKHHISLRPENIKFYPIKTIETFYIYESKINNKNFEL